MFIGVDIGGSKILVASADAKMKPKQSLRIPTPDSAKLGLEQITHLIKQIADGHQISAIGISSAGGLDFARGELLDPPNFPWHHVKLVQPLAKAFGVPVVIENDANAAALAERVWGAGRKFDPLLYVTISTGIGTGFIIGDEVFHGAHDVEGGHIIIDPGGPVCGCGGRGHFESMASGRAIEARYGHRASEIHDKRIWDEIARQFAIGLASLATTLSPAGIVLGGGVAVHYNRFKQPLERHLAKMPSVYPMPKVVPAKFIETAPIYGTFLLARRAYYRRR
jgi:glucokinase